MILLDNVKSLRFSSADIESLITARTISGHQMYAGEGGRPNYFTVLVTSNAAALSEDLAQRAIPIELGRPTYTLDWLTEVERYIESRRLAIAGDSLAALQAGPRPVTKVLRWSAWQAAVLARMPEPDRLVDLITARQTAVNEDLSGAS